MASGVFPGIGCSIGLTSGTITANLSGTVDNTSCNRVGRIVNVSGRVYGGSYVGTAVTIFTIPEGFRPPAPVKCSVGCSLSTVAYAIMPGTINTDGTVVTGYSATAPVTGYYFTACYSV